jgi:hypothetical protein
VKKTLVPLLIGASVGVIIGLLTGKLAVWLGIGAGGGFLIGLWLTMAGASRKN